MHGCMGTVSVWGERRIYQKSWSYSWNYVLFRACTNTTDESRSLFIAIVAHFQCIPDTFKKPTGDADLRGQYIPIGRLVMAWQLLYHIRFSSPSRILSELDMPHSFQSLLQNLGRSFDGSRWRTNDLIRVATCARALELYDM